MSEANRKAARPIVIGVTGHRNFTSDDPKISSLVRKELRRIVRAGRGAPLLILSGLAEGADRLVAHVAREAFDAALWAILPLPDALYLRDFSKRASIKEYNSLKTAAKRIIEAPLMASRRAVSRYGEPRNHQYAWIGAFIARRAQVLVALWDGSPARGTGGTEQVVNWFLSGRVPREYCISRAPCVRRRARASNMLVHINPETHKVKRRKCSRTRR